MNIDHLLNKYWDAETSLEEEQILHEYFNSAQVAENHKQFEVLFNVFETERSIKLKKTLEKPTSKNNIIRLRTIGIAASILLAIGVLFLNKDTPKVSNINVVSIETPEEALAYTREALALVSGNLTKGSAQLRKGLKPLSKVDILIH